MDVDSVDAIPSEPKEKLQEESVQLDAPPAAGVVELESDDDAQPPAQREMDLLVGELEDELEDEVLPANGGEKDTEILRKDSGPFPALPPSNCSEPSGARKKVLARVKRQAADALEEGNVTKAIAKYTEVLTGGDASAQVLATRASLLLAQKKPCAAIRDCCAAILLNSSCSKAFHVRALAQRKLGHYKKAYRDFTQGQKLSFDQAYVSIHQFVAKQIGIYQDPKTGRWFQKQVEKPVVETVKAPEPPPKVQPRSDLRPGQAVRVDGLVKAPQLNRKRGVIVRLDPAGNGRWEVELRLDKGRVETKSLKGDNIFVVPAKDAGPWKEEEKKHLELRKEYEKDEKRWKAEEEKRQKELAQARKDAGDFLDMDPAELLEAEMSTLPLDEQTMSLLRRLRPEQALGIVRQGSVAGLSGISAFVTLKAKRLLGYPDSDDEGGLQLKAPTIPSKLRDPSHDYDPEKLEEDTEPLPPVPPPEPPEDKNSWTSKKNQSWIDEGEFIGFEVEARYKDKWFWGKVTGTAPGDLIKVDVTDFGEYELELSEVKVFDNCRKAFDSARCRHFAAEATDANNHQEAVAKYSEAILCGCASASILVKRAEALLKLRRPKAAIQDCEFALQRKPDFAKAFRVRGIANRRLQNWREAHSDLTEAQKLDYDEATVDVHTLVVEKLQAYDEWHASLKRSSAEFGGDAKRLRT